MSLNLGEIESAISKAVNFRNELEEIWKGFEKLPFDTR